MRVFCERLSIDVNASIPFGFEGGMWDLALRLENFFSCSTQLTMNFLLLINVKMPTIVGILTFMSGKNSILCLSEPKKVEFLDIFYTYGHVKFHAQLSWA